MYNKIQKQLEVLKSKVSFLGSIKVEDQLQALDQIGEMGTPYDVQYIFQYVFSDNELISQKSAEVIRKLLTKQAVREAWLNLYGSLSRYYGYHSERRMDLKKFESFSSEEALHLYGVASLNYDGYVREEALGFLGKLSSEALPYVLLRLNDWVPEVQAKAKAVLLDILPRVSVEGFVQAYRLIEWLEKTERVNLEDVQDLILSQISDSHNREALWKVMEKSTLRERLFCWKALSEAIQYEKDLVEKVMADPAPEIRQWAAQHLPESEYFRDRVKILASDKAVRVRQAALKAIPYDDFSEYRSLFEKAMFDDSKPIREYARFMLRSKGDEDCVEQYRQRLAELKEKANIGLVAGLAEIGTQEDIPMMKAFINHKKAKIRASVLYGLSRLQAEGMDDVYLLGLQDNNAKVRNTCVSILKSDHRYLRPELESLLKNGNLRSKKIALEVLVHYGGLDSLKDILWALSEQSEELQKVAWQHLASWYRQYGSNLAFSVSLDTYEEIRELLEELRKIKMDPPPDVLHVWQALPNIMEAIKK